MAGLTDRLKRLFGTSGPDEAGKAPVGPFAARTSKRATGPRWAEQETDLFSKPDDVYREGTAPDLQAARDGNGRKPFVTPYYFWGALALVTAGFAIGGLVFHVLQDQEQEAVAAGTGLPDPLLPLEETARQALLRPTPELAAELKRSFLGKPDDFCAELQALGLKNRGWRRAPFRKGSWQCDTELVPLTTPSVDFGATTLFLLLRGPSEDSVDYLRLKLVVEDPRQKQIGLDAVWLVIDALAGRYGWTVPDNFRSAVASFEDLETIHRGVRLSVAPEDPNLTGDPLASQRLNIIMDFGEPDLIRPADRFEQAPPLESGWSLRDRDGRAGE